MSRTCGGCVACCEILPVKELGKGQFTRCQLLNTIPHKDGPGCRVYPARPQSCRMWSCVWLRTEDMPEEFRPDRCGFVIDEVKDLISVNGEERVAAQIWAAPGSEEAWREETAHRVIQGLLEQGHCTAVLWRQRGQTARAFIIVEDGVMGVTDVSVLDTNAAILGDEVERARKLRRLAGVER